MDAKIVVVSQVPLSPAHIPFNKIMTHSKGFKTSNMKNLRLDPIPSPDPGAQVLHRKDQMQLGFGRQALAESFKTHSYVTCLVARQMRVAALPNQWTQRDHPSPASAAAASMRSLGRA